MSLIGNVDTPAEYVASYMQACVGMLGIPAGGFVSEIEAFGSDTGYDVESLYSAMMNSTVGRGIYAPGSSNETFAAKLVAMLGGSLLEDEEAAVDEVLALLDGGMSRAQAAMTAVEFVANMETGDDVYGDVAQQFQNRITVANYYTFQTTSPASTVATLQAVLSAVDHETDVTDPADVINVDPTPTDNQAGTSADDTIRLLGGLDSTIKIEGGQQGAAGDTLYITAEASATANIIDLTQYADQNRTLDSQGRKVSPIVQGFENVDATESTTEMNITARDRTSEANTGGVAATQTGSVIQAGAYRDTVTGGAGNDSIVGNAGNDVLTGNAGNDTIAGGLNNDNIAGGAGNDTITDGSGDDTVTGDAGNDTITIGGGLDAIDGGADNDTITFESGVTAGTSATVRTTVLGGAGTDSIDNTNASATSFLVESGNAGNDTITMGVALETISGGADNDIIVIKQAALDQTGTVAAGTVDVLNGNDGQDALQLTLTTGDATTTFVLAPVDGQYSGFEVIELIDGSGNTAAKTYKVNLTDNFVANNLATGRFLIDARGLPAGSNLVIDTSALTAASAAAFTAGNFQVWTSPSTDVRDQLNKTITSTYAMNSSNAALNATTAFYVNSADTTNKAGVHDATTGLISTTPSGATAYTTTGGTAESGTTGTTTGGNTFTLTAANAVITPTTSSNATPAGTMTAGNDTVNAVTLSNGAFVQDSSTTDADVFNAVINANSTPVLMNVETINATMAGATLTLTNTTGATQVNVDGANGTVATGNSTMPLINLVSGYAGTATVTSNAAADAQTIRLSGTSNASVTSTVSTAVTVNVAANSTLATLTAAAGTVNVTGSANLGVTTLATLTGLNAGTFAGNLTVGNIAAVTVTGGTGADSFTQTTAVNATVAGGDGNDTFSFGATGTLDNGDSVNGGNGIDTVALTADRLTGATDFDNVSNIEVITTINTVNDVVITTQEALVAVGATLTLNASATLTGAGNLNFDGSLENNGFFNITGGNSTAAGDTILGGLNADTITGGAGADTITGNGGNDSIILTDASATAAAATGSDTVVFAATAAANGIDVITGFTTAGTAAGGDVLDFTAFLGGAASGLTAYTANPGVATDLTADGIITLVDIAGGQDISTAAGLQAALTVGGEYVNLDNTTAAVETYVFLTAASAAATSYNVFYVNFGNAGADPTAVSLVGTVSGTANIASLAAANFA